MVRKLKNNELLKRLDKLQDLMKYKASEPVLVSIQEWLDSTGTDSFIEYCEKQLHSKSPNSFLLIDDLILETGMYLNLECVMILSKDEVSKFVELAVSSEERFMEEYIEAFERMYVVPDKELSNQESILKKSGAFVNDFYEQYKVLSVEQLVERYKDQKFFRIDK